MSDIAQFLTILLAGAIFVVAAIVVADMDLSYKREKKKMALTKRQQEQDEFIKETKKQISELIQFNFRLAKSIEDIKAVIVDNNNGLRAQEKMLEGMRQYSGYVNVVKFEPRWTKE